eukprot:TRINITY_DN63815_c0_g1_i1.p1 TRINITY_DN63815_c0_g1~~TRINITY_DN63815_c0_g1_i1.p1  ORF type:complete len:205 (-),score=20.16 TRINITY_DN63815_c0_g1_i1:10-624(-)
MGCGTSARVYPLAGGDEYSDLCPAGISKAAPKLNRFAPRVQTADQDTEEAAACQHSLAKDPMQESSPLCASTVLDHPKAFFVRGKPEKLRHFDDAEMENFRSMECTTAINPRHPCPPIRLLDVIKGERFRKELRGATSSPKPLARLHHGSPATSQPRQAWVATSQRSRRRTDLVGVYEYPAYETIGKPSTPRKPRKTRKPCESR